MSKGPDGPSAQSFDNPRKVGWLQKHGGSGMSSHWKKRWFIVDHHYLFYFKGPNDKKPVGILCLPEYQSCYKADNKVSKKPNSFVLDRGSDPEGDGPSKNYILHTDSEKDMEKWIAAIKEEMKPILGDSSFSSYSKNTPKPKIDQKAFDEVTAIATEGPKLSHPTASRPKPRGRRPPKRYAVFHEDDSKDDDSPTITPSSSSTSLPQPSSPPSTPTSSPKVPNKGSHPAAPILPKMHMTPPTKPKTTATELVESGSSSPKIKPEPPKKVPSRDRQNSVSSPDSPKAEPKPAPKPSPRPPAVPKKPTAAGPTEPSTQVEVPSEPVSNEVKPPPSIRPKPSPPRAKPRTASTSIASRAEVTSGVTNNADSAPALPPQPKPRRSMSPEPDVVPAPAPVPAPVPARKPRPVPARRKPEVPKPSTPKPPSPEEKLQGSEITAEDKEVAIELVTKNDEKQLEAIVMETSVIGNGIEQVELEERRIENEKKEENKSVDENPSKEVNGSIETEENTTYENVTSSEQNGKENEMEKIEDDHGSYEEMNYEEEEMSKVNGSGKAEEEDHNQSAYVDMSPGVMDQAADADQNKSDDYEPVVVVEEDNSDSKDYEMPQWSEQDVASTRSSVGFVPTGVVGSNAQDEKMVIYDVPPSPRPAYDDRPVSTATSDSPMASQILEAGSRSNSITSDESSTSKNSSDILSERARAESKGKAWQMDTKAVNTTDPTPNLEQRLESLEDSIGKVELTEASQNGMEKPSEPSNLYEIRETETVAKALQQAKEILRLAKAAKAEADQIKKESARELELAKRERHDASLMKKNAAEILRIAKTKLGK